MSEFAALSNGFTQNPKVLGLHDRAFRLYMISIDYCSSNLTDGHVSARAVKVCSAILDSPAKRWWTELVGAGLLKHDKAGDGFWIHDYLKHNVKASALKKLKDQRREAGVRGAEKRWGKKRDGGDDGGSHDGKSHSKSHSKTHMPAEQKQVVGLDQSSGRHFQPPPGAIATGLPFASELLVARLMRAVGKDADDGTESVLRAYAQRASEAHISRVIESLEQNAPRNRAAYAVAALRDEIDTREEVA